MQFSTIEHLTPISNCGVIQGVRIPSYDELTQFAPSDGNIAYSDGTYTLTARSGGRYIFTGGTADLSDITRVEDTVPVVGDFDVFCRADFTATTDMIGIFYARIDDGNFLGVSDNVQGGNLQASTWVNGSRTFRLGGSIDPYGTVVFRIIRRNLSFKFYVSTDNGVTFSFVHEITRHVEDPMYIGFGIDDVSQDIASVDLFKCNSGYDTDEVLVKPGLVFFDSTKTFGTGIDDGTLYDGSGGANLTNDGDLSIISPSVRVAMDNSGNDLSLLPRFELDNNVSGDFELECCYDGGKNNPDYAMVCLGVKYGSAQDYAMTWVSTGSAISLYGGPIVGGTRTLNGGTVGGVHFIRGLCRLRLKRVGNTFTFAASFDDYDWADYAGEDSFTYAFPASGVPFIGVDRGNAAHQIFFKSIYLRHGTDDGEVLVHTPDDYALVSDTGYGWDKPTIDDTVIDALTAEYKLAEYATQQTFSDVQDVNANASWNGSWLTKAALQSLANTENRYIYLKAKLTPDNNLSDYSSFSVEQYKTDFTPPSPVTDPVVFFHGDVVATIDIPLKLINGNDTGTAEYAGYSLARYNSGTWEYQQSDGTWSSTEGDYTTVLVHAGDPATEALDWIANQPDTVTKLRFTGWDTAGNHSTRVDATLTEIGQVPAPATALTITDTGDGITWTVSATTTEGNPAVYLYDHADDSLVAVLDGEATTADLTAGQEIYCKIGAAEKTLSERYPAASGVEVPAITVLDIPDREDVLNVATVLGLPGRWAPADTTLYALGNTFGIDGASETGTYQPPQAATPTDFTVSDTGDGITWTVTAATTDSAASVYVYDQSDDSLVTIVDTSGLTAELTAGTEVYCKTLAAGHRLSDRYPAATGVEVPIRGVAPAPPANPATGFSVTNTADGITLTVETDTEYTDAAVYVFNNDTDELVSVLDAYAITTDLNGVGSVYCKICTPNRSLSTRYPATGVTVPTPSKPLGPTVPTLTVTDKADGSGASVRISGSDSGTTNTVYVAPYGSSAWERAVVISYDNTADISLDLGHYWAYAKSKLNGYTSQTAPVEFNVTDLRWIEMETHDFVVGYSGVKIVARRQAWLPGPSSQISEGMRLRVEIMETDGNIPQELFLWERHTLFNNTDTKAKDRFLCVAKIADLSSYPINDPDTGSDIQPFYRLNYMDVVLSSRSDYTLTWDNVQDDLTALVRSMVELGLYDSTES
jgi:hypothetical protein